MLRMIRRAPGYGTPGTEDDITGHICLTYIHQLQQAPNATQGRQERRALLSICLLCIGTRVPFVPLPIGNLAFF